MRAWIKLGNASLLHLVRQRLALRDELEGWEWVGSGQAGQHGGDGPVSARVWAAVVPQGSTCLQVPCFMPQASGLRAALVACHHTAALEICGWGRARAQRVPVPHTCARPPAESRSCRWTPFAAAA